MVLHSLFWPLSEVNYGYSDVHVVYCDVYAIYREVYDVYSEAFHGQSEVFLIHASSALFFHFSEVKRAKSEVFHA